MLLRYKKAQCRTFHCFSFNSGIIIISLTLKMDALCVIPYEYKPHKIRRRGHGAKSRLEVGTTCYSSHLEGGNDFSRASEIRQTTPNIHNLEDEVKLVASLGRYS
jgi:hypothetical protein